MSSKNASKQIHNSSLCQFFNYVLCKILIYLIMSWNWLLFASFRILVKVVTLAVSDKYTSDSGNLPDEVFPFHTVRVSFLILCFLGTSSIVISIYASFIFSAQKRRRARLPDRDRRIACDGPANRRHVRGRRVAEKDARGIRLPPAVGA